MADLGNFDANQVEPSQAFDLIPDGWIEAMITESDKKTTAKGDGKYVKLTLSIIDSRYPNRLLWDNLNLENPNQQTVNIARGTLSAICRAVGVLTPRDSTQLHNIPMLVKVGHETRKDNGEVKNVIKGYKARDAAAPVQPAPIQKQMAAATPNGGAAPWKK